MKGELRMSDIEKYARRAYYELVRNPDKYELEAIINQALERFGYYRNVPPAFIGTIEGAIADDIRAAGYAKP